MINAGLSAANSAEQAAKAVEEQREVALLEFNKRCEYKLSLDAFYKDWTLKRINDGKIIRLGKSAFLITNIMPLFDRLNANSDYAMLAVMFNAWAGEVFRRDGRVYDEFLGKELDK